MKINVRQICFIFLIYPAVSKFLLYPTVLSVLCQRDLLVPAIAGFLFEGLAVWSVAYLCSKTDKTFFTLLRDNIGDIGARIVFGLFAAVLITFTILPIFEQKLYVHNIFYDTVPSLNAFMPFFVLSAYAASKDLRNTGRCADICLPVFIVCMALIFGMSIGEVKWSNLLPVLKTPSKDIISGTFGSLSYFIEPCWMLMFMGHFKYKKWDAAKITISYGIGAAVTVLFLAVFFGIYGGAAETRTFAIARLSLFFPAIETMGRVDLILLFILEIVMLFGIIINLQLAVYAICKCTGYENRAIVSVVVNFSLFLILLFANNYYNSIFDFYFNWLWIAFAAFTLLLPPLSWALRRRRKQ